MATVDMTQAAGGSTIRSDVGPGGGGAGGGIDAFGSLMNQIIARRMATAEEDRRRRMALEDEAAGDRATARTRDKLEYSRMNVARNARPAEVTIGGAGGRLPAASRAALSNRSGGRPQLDALQTEAAGAELSSALRGPTQRYVTAGPGIIGGGLTNDLSRMNAIDRKLYLPSDSRTIEGPSDEDLAGDADRNATFEMRRRARMAAMQGPASETVRGRSRDETGGNQLGVGR